MAYLPQSAMSPPWARSSLISAGFVRPRPGMILCELRMTSERRPPLRVNAAVAARFRLVRARVEVSGVQESAQREGSIHVA